MRRTMKTYALVCMALFTMAFATACGTDTGSGESEETSLPINAYESTIEESKQGSSSKQPDKSEPNDSSSMETESSQSSQSSGESSGSAESSQPNLPDTPSESESPEKEKKLVPEKGAALTEDTPLNLVFINGTEFDILDCTVQDIVKGGVVHNFGNTHTSDLEALGYYFFGEGFTVGFNDKSVVQIEALENERLITKNAWQHQYDEEYEVASHYEVKAVSYGRYAEDEGFVQFCGGIQVGMDKDEIDKVLGRGYEIAIPDNNLLISASCYKTPTTTMMVEYEKSGRAYTITVFKN